MTSSENISTKINSHLQKNIDFVVENKVIKSGKIILFSVKDFFCSFLLLNENKKKRFLYEIPYPFNVSIDESNIVFDYTLDSFLKNNPLIKDDLIKFRNKKPSKLFNKKLIL
ncbi:MAG: hypothetical protein EBU90_25065, partial [Proteobacteria bacterium]|nr:hypothetical protein [Pseudomonadota bacterium]